MDLIETIITKAKNKITNSSIGRSISYIMLLYFVLGMTTYIFVKILCSGWYTVIMQRYGLISVYGDKVSSISGNIKYVLGFLQLVSNHSAIFWVLLAEIIGIRQFVRLRLTSETQAVHNALEYLTLGDLSHEQAFTGSDEIGELAAQTEALRLRLLEGRRDEWELQKEQKSINSAFAHDMRTPLTVMKGYTEFLLKFIPQGKLSQEAVLERLRTILEQQERLLEFSKTMSEIQNIEMWELHCTPVSIEKLSGDINSMTLSLLNDSQSSNVIVDDCTPASLALDYSLVMEVCENLVSNAVRYARSLITVRLSFADERLIVYVEDDGPGFSAGGLEHAATLYWTEGSQKDNHFGMGLYMCSKLCEKHGGALRHINKINGGAIVSAEFKTHISE